MADDQSSRPLLAHSRTDHGEGSARNEPASTKPNVSRLVAECRSGGREALSSRSKHYIVMTFVAFDVTALLANVFIQLIACEMHQLDEPWVQGLTSALEIAGLVFSTFFILELAACLFAFGPSYLSSWFHLFDSAVVIVSFLIDVATHGLTESIGSLVIVLRLWRLAKISEEVVLGASERLEILEHQLEELEEENKEMRAQLGMPRHESAGHD